MKVKNILENKLRRGQILKVDGSDMLSQAVKVMVENDTGSVAVYNGDAFIGMLTFREILTSIHHSGFDAAANAPCSDIIEKNGICTTPDDSVDQIRNMMTSKHIRYLPVVTDGDVVGVISFYDVARSVAKAATFENRMLKEYIGDWPGETPENE